MHMKVQPLLLLLILRNSLTSTGFHLGFAILLSWILKIKEMRKFKEWNCATALPSTYIPILEAAYSFQYPFVSSAYYFLRSSRSKK